MDVAELHIFRDRNNIHRLSEISRRWKGTTPVLFTREMVSETDARAEKTVDEKAIALLSSIADKSGFFGQTVTLEFETDFPLAGARSAAELRNLTAFVKSSGFTAGQLTLGGKQLDVAMEVEGYRELERAKKRIRSIEKVFVAMSFSTQLEAAYKDAISPAVVSSGYEPIRIDQHDHNEQIVGEIMAQISMSRFVVADFTGHRNGVYFEAGYAKGLGIPVIWLCKDTEIGGAHFDTNHFNHLLWNDVDKLRESLKQRILITIGPGPKFVGK